jgi:hypothetical protein
MVHILFQFKFLANIVLDQTRAILMSPKALDLIVGTLSNKEAVGHHAVLCMVNELLNHGVYKSG